MGRYFLMSLPPHRHPDTLPSSPALWVALGLSLALHALPFVAEQLRPKASATQTPRATPKLEARLTPLPPQVPLTVPPPSPPPETTPPEPHPLAHVKAPDKSVPKSAPERKTLAKAPSATGWQNEVRKQLRQLHEAGRYYPAEAIAQGLEGEASVLLILDESGNVAAARLEQSTGHRILDDAALRAARSLKALPADAPRETVLPIRFRLR